MSLQTLAALANKIPFHPIPGAQLFPQQSVTPFPLDKAVTSTLFASEPRPNSSRFHKELLFSMRSKGNTAFLRILVNITCPLKWFKLRDGETS